MMDMCMSDISCHSSKRKRKA